MSTGGNQSHYWDNKVVIKVRIFCDKLRHNNDKFFKSRDSIKRFRMERLLKERRKENQMILKTSSFIYIYTEAVVRP